MTSEMLKRILLYHANRAFARDLEIPNHSIVASEVLFAAALAMRTHGLELEAF